MFKTLTAAILSGMIALTSLTATASPARAMDSDTLGKLLFGAAALGVVAKIYNDRQDDKDRKKAARKSAKSPSQTYWHHHGSHGHHSHSGSGAHSHSKTPNVSLPRLRVQCKRRLNTERGWVNFYSQACLDRRNVAVEVPQSCLRQRWVDGRWRQYFSRPCLRKHGQVDNA
ncbi:hypothetical protein [Dinoroseobacter sp. S375]|uniref:hypothetical protein n=1 Tax=Dinoroseobacter sp. S375 TaxID=3415136 RepID=UPI003C7BF4DA